MGASADASAPAAAAASDEGAAYKRTADGRMILEEIPYSGVRKIIGDKLAESKFTAPHLYFTQKVDMINALKVVGKKMEDCTMAVSGAGAAAISITKLLMNYGLKDAILCDSKGAIYEGRTEGMRHLQLM